MNLNVDNSKLLAKIYMNKRVFPSIVFWTTMCIATIVNSVLVANYYGDIGMTIVSVYTPITTIWWVFAAGLGVAGAAIFSKMQGRNDREEANKIAGDFSGLTLFLGIVLTIIGLVFLLPLTKFLINDNEQMIQMAYDFGLWTVITTPFMLYCSVLCDFASADNAPKLAMITIIVQNGLNLILDVIFMGIFDVGPQGAAMGFFFSTVVALGVVLLHYKSKGATMTFRLSLPKRKLYPQIFKYSYSAMVASAYDAIALLILNKLVLDNFGLVAATVFFMTSYAIVITKGPYLGISTAVLSVQTAFLGGGNNRGAKWATIISLRSSLIITGIITVILLLFPDIIALLYNIDTPGFAEEYNLGIRLVALSLPFRAVNYIMYSSYIGVGRSLFSLIITTLRSFVLLLLVGYIAMGIGSFSLFLSGSLIAEVGTFIIWVICAMVQRRRKKLDSLLLLDPKNENLGNKCEILIHKNIYEIRQYQDRLKDFLSTHKVSSKKMHYSVLALEEIIIYCINEKSFSPNSYIYFEAIVTECEKVRLIARFDTKAEKIIGQLRKEGPQDDKFIGLRYLYNSSGSFVYNRVLGLNNIDITY